MFTLHLRHRTGARNWTILTHQDGQPVEFITEAHAHDNGQAALLDFGSKYMEYAIYQRQGTFTIETKVVPIQAVT